MVLPKRTKPPNSAIIAFGLCAIYGFILSYLISLGILSQMKLLIPLVSILAGIGVFGTVVAFYQQKSLGIAFDSVYRGYFAGSITFMVISILFQFFS